MMALTFGSLFSGIGGIDLGFERAGMSCAWQVEIDGYCNRVLEKHWPDVRRYKDVKEIHGIVAHASSSDGGDNNEHHVGWGNETKSAWDANWIGRNSTVRETLKACSNCLPPVDVIAGGFPCQPYSVAGKRKGADDDRNLWPEYLRLITELRPTWVVGENVPGIITTYLNTVLSDLESAGYEVATFNLPAVALDAKHRRERIFVVAYAENSNDTQGRSKGGGASAQSRNVCSRNGNVSNTNAKRRKEQRRPIPTEQKHPAVERGSFWPIEPDVGRVAHGVPHQVDRLRGLGNAVVPAVAEFVGRAIVVASDT